MADLKKQIKNTHTALEKALKQASSVEQLEQVRIAFLGRNGTIAELMTQLKPLPVDEKRACGPLLNQLKKNTQAAYDAAVDALKKSGATLDASHRQLFDVTAYRHTDIRGSLHVYTPLIEKLEDIFSSMGFTIADGPEVETDFYNFEALNIPKDHPARDMQDTFYLNVPDMLMRTQTSNVQLHAMQEKGAPLAVFSPGRVYRNEARDASHDFAFMQGEGLLIGKNVSVANLLATARTFLQAIFGDKKIKIRVRPGFFPFVEPGLEIDATCPFCTDGCSICKHTKWIELLGAGLIHPHVLKSGGIDPTEYSGFAFGFGIGRIAMITHGIKDIRLLHSSNIQFLNQFI